MTSATRTSYWELKRTGSTSKSHVVFSTSARTSLTQTHSYSLSWAESTTALQYYSIPLRTQIYPHIPKMLCCNGFLKMYWVTWHTEGEIFRLIPTVLICFWRPYVVCRWRPKCFYNISCGLRASPLLVGCSTGHILVSYVGRIWQKTKAVHNIIQYVHVFIFFFWAVWF